MQTIINIRPIRCMSLSPIFAAHFERAVQNALTTGVQGALVEGCTHGVASALIYLAEALLFFVGATLIARGTYTYLQMVEVLNLVVFSVTIGAQLMAFTERIAKAVQATADLRKLTTLPERGAEESCGSLTPAAGAGRGDRAEGRALRVPIRALHARPQGRLAIHRPRRMRRPRRRLRFGEEYPRRLTPAPLPS